MINRLRRFASLGSLSAGVLACAAGAVAQEGEKPEPARAKSAAAGPIFDLGKERALRIVVTQGEETPALDESSTPMLRALSGILADLKGKGIEDLRACVPPNPALGDLRGAERLCTVHVIGKKDRAPKRVTILREADGNFVASEVEGAGGAAPNRVELRKDSFAAVMASWTVYRGTLDAKEVKEKRGEVFELEKPYVPGRFTIDQATLSARFLSGHKTKVEGSARELDTEKFFARLPAGYDPRKPAGLLVWVDATPSGRPPEEFNQALDDLNFVCIGAAESGNTRVVSTRYQLALDAVATAERRFHIDPRRVYISGVSGGGKVASMMQGCFPEVYMGAVPIVGICFYDNVPTGTGHYWPAGFAKPKSELFAMLKQRRIAAMTGRKDFNRLEIEQTTELYQRDGMQVKMFEDPKMGHEIPKADRFGEALLWVDDPYAKMRKAEETAAREALDAAVGKTEGGKEAAGGGGAMTEAVRKLYVKVTEVGPWTEPAWKAAAVLGKGVSTAGTDSGREQK